MSRLLGSRRNDPISPSLCPPEKSVLGRLRRTAVWVRAEVRRGVAAWAAVGAPWDIAPDEEAGSGIRRLHAEGRNQTWQRETAAANPPAPKRTPRTSASSLGLTTNDLLINLGDDASAVAPGLMSAGARGSPGDPSDSPLLSYIAAVVGVEPGVAAVSVEGRKLLIRRQSRWRRTVKLDLPPAVRNCIAAFDAGCYPELIRGGR